MMSSRLPYVAMMSGDVLDVEPFLISRNTLGNGKTVNSKSQMSNVKMVVAGMRWWLQKLNGIIEM